MMLIKAPYILTGEKILKDHAILVQEERIISIGAQKDFSSVTQTLELEQMILFPGLINCHCHLELSNLPEKIAYPGSFVGWIEQLTQLKLQMSPQETEQGILQGIQKLLQGGTTTVADHLSTSTSPQTLIDSMLEGFIYAEVLGVEPMRAKKFYGEALDLENIKDPHGHFQIVATPHASYSLLPEIFSQVVHERNGQFPLSIHIAESVEEFLLFKEKRGPLFEFLEMKGKTPVTLGETPLQYLHRLNLLPFKGMAIHANYLEDEDIDILQKFSMSVIHCPGCHLYFEHERFPLGLLQDGDINIALGTDSLASNDSLSMLKQMQVALDQYAELTPQTVLRMATLHGAKALGREHEIGSLEAGKFANIVGVRLKFPKKGAMENIFLSEKIDFSMIRGNCCHPPKGML